MREDKIRRSRELKKKNRKKKSIIPAIITFFRFIATLFKPTNEYGDIFIPYN